MPPTSSTATLMPEFLSAAFTAVPLIAPWDVFARLLVAFGFGMLIGIIYRWTRRSPLPGSTFPMTLVLLCVLIAMVTQVIGNNVARAFSLVGALSIVRFRTVVRDTQDTAYVILSVIVGMAVGAQSLWVAAIGVGVVGLAELLCMAYTRISPATPPELLLRIRTGTFDDPDALVEASLGESLASRELMSMGTLKQGDGLEACYRLVPKTGVSITALIRLLGAAGGVHNVQLVRRGFDAE